MKSGNVRKRVRFNGAGPLGRTGRPFLLAPFAFSFGVELAHNKSPAIGIRIKRRTNSALAGSPFDDNPIAV
jgi:hypothetical protein